jgi:cytochrome c biogenesis protein
MKLLKLQKYFKIFTDLKFALFILSLLAIVSSFGSIIEQDELPSFYQENYPSTAPIYGWIDFTFILNSGLDHVYTTSWFFSLLFTLAICLISCTITRQFPIFFNAKECSFKKKYGSFFNLNFFIRLKNIPYLKEAILFKIQNMNFYLYQKFNLIYGYKGLVGRISPILVHFSLLLILGGSFLGAFENFKAQEILPKGELFHIQNTLRIGFLTDLPLFNIRVNDFWSEYENNRIHQFYSNISILDALGNELTQRTISVNHPLRYQNIDFYQSDWNLLGIRVENLDDKKIYELPLFQLKENTKSWVTWIPMNLSQFSSSFSSFSINEVENKLNSQIIDNKLGVGQLGPTLIFDQFQNLFFIYNQKGQFLGSKNIGDLILPNLKILEILPATGLLIKYDPSIPIIYLGFAILMITTLLSYLPYTQIWFFNQGKEIWIGSSTNRGKIQLELQLENLIREAEKNIKIFGGFNVVEHKLK